MTRAVKFAYEQRLDWFIRRKCVLKSNKSKTKVESAELKSVKIIIMAIKDVLKGMT